MAAGVGGYTSPFSPGDVTQLDEHNITSGDPREWGVDVGLKPETVIRAPFAGTVQSYTPSSSEWGPGRLLLAGGPKGETWGFGHIVDLALPGTKVQAGDVIGYVPANAPGGPHTEVMVFPDPSNISRAGAVDPRNWVGMAIGAGGGPSAGADWLSRLPANERTKFDALTPQQQQQVLDTFSFQGHDPGNPVGWLADRGKDAVGAAAGAAGGAIADLFGTAASDIGIFSQRNVVALAVAAAVLLVVFH